MKSSYLFKFLLTLVLFIAVGHVNAANRGVISGKVIDKHTKQPIPYVAVTLGVLPDSTVKKSVLTDDQGNFKFEEVAEGKYVVGAYMVGYGRKHSKPIVCRQTSVKVDDIVLENTIIKEVTVVGKRPEIEMKADRTVMNIENTVTAAAENAYEVLRKAPGVNIDKDDKISLKGKEGVLVTINDKSTYLSGQDLANYLKTLNGTEIEKVELITTPPARYEAAGNVGIINIKLKKNNKIGINGSTNAGILITRKVGGNAGINLNMRQGKLNTFASISGNKGFYKSKNMVDKRINGDTAQIYQKVKSLGDWGSLNFRVGADYDINKRHTIGVMARSNFSEEDGDQTTLTNLNLRNGDLGKRLISKNEDGEHNKNFSYNLNYKFTIDTSGRSLNVDADYVQYRNRGYQNGDTYYYNGAGTEISHPVYIKDTKPSDIYIKSFRADYVHPFSKIVTLETGVKGSLVNSDNNLKSEKMVFPMTDYINDLGRSNHFKYEESILAGYASIAYEKAGWSVKGGLRAEQTWGRGNQVTIGTINKRNSLDFFPTFYVMRTINEKNSLSFSYNRRIDRPSYSKMNPFVSRIDEYTYQEGNPNLRAQYTDNIEINHSWANRVFTSISYSHTKDVQMQVLEEVDIVKPANGGTSENVKASKIVERNIKDLNGFTCNVSANFQPFKWYRTNTNLTGMYNSYNRGEGKSGNSKLMYMIYSSNSFILPKSYVFEVMLRYNSPMAYGMIDLKSQSSVNIGLQKKLLAGKITLKASADDIFKTMNSRARANYDGMNLYTKSEWTSQRINLSVVYRFGSKDVKQARQRSTSSEEEQNRTGK